MLGFVDARRRERKEFAWYTERQEWDRALAALQGLLPEAEAATLMGEGAGCPSTTPLISRRRI